jgi:hypothetical protein
MSYFDHSPILISQLVLSADEATTRWTLRADLAAIEPQLARHTLKTPSPGVNECNRDVTTTDVWHP